MEVILSTVSSFIEREKYETNMIDHIHIYKQISLGLQNRLGCNMMCRLQSVTELKNDLLFVSVVSGTFIHFLTVLDVKRGTHMALLEQQSNPALTQMMTFRADTLWECVEMTISSPGGSFKTGQSNKEQNTSPGNGTKTSLIVLFLCACLLLACVCVCTQLLAGA